MGEQDNIGQGRVGWGKAGHNRTGQKREEKAGQSSSAGQAGKQSVTRRHTEPLQRLTSSKDRTELCIKAEMAANCQG